MGEGPACSADHVDTSRACAFAFRSSIRQARKTLRVARFCALVGAGADDGRLVDNPVRVVEKTFSTRHEPAAHIDSGFRHNALALCLHWTGNQTVIFSP